MRRPNTVSLLVRAGFLPQAARLTTKLGAVGGIPGYLAISRAELSLARGEVDRGMAELEQGIRSVGEAGFWTSFLGSETLAAAWKRKGDLARAVQVLERASERRSSAAFERSGAVWLRCRFQLAQLYREAGREKDARRIEEELRQLLALADLDHPIRRELDRLKGS